MESHDHTHLAGIRHLFFSFVEKMSSFFCYIFLNTRFSCREMFLAKHTRLQMYLLQLMPSLLDIWIVPAWLLAPFTAYLMDIHSYLYSRKVLRWCSVFLNKLPYLKWKSRRKTKWQKKKMFLSINQTKRKIFYVERANNWKTKLVNFS